MRPQRRRKKIRAKFMKDVAEVEGMGWLSIIVDPTGAVLGLWEPKDRLQLPRCGWCHWALRGCAAKAS